MGHSSPVSDPGNNSTKHEGFDRPCRPRGCCPCRTLLRWIWIRPWIRWIGYGGYGYGRGYGGYGGYYRGKRSAEAEPDAEATAVAEPEAEAEADPYYYGGYGR